jgi:hypothetical protein
MSPSQRGSGVKRVALLLGGSIGLALMLRAMVRCYRQPAPDPGWEVHYPVLTWTGADPWEDPWELPPPL